MITLKSKLLEFGLDYKRSRRRKRLQRPILIKALRLINEITSNALCDCNDPKKTSKPGYHCISCEIYGIVHGALGCGASKCPVARSGLATIKKWRPS